MRAGSHSELCAQQAAALLSAAVLISAMAPGPVRAQSGASPAAQAAAPVTKLEAVPPTPVDAGFRLLYELNFAEARADFLRWQNEHPADPLGPAAEGASYLFQEFYQQGVLTSEFFLDDKRLLGGITGTPDPALGNAFHSAVDRSQKLALPRLDHDPRDAQALFAMTITTGMLANYASLIEKRQVATLHLLRQSEGYAVRLLAVQPDAGDAYVALGVSNYILSCLPAYKRFVLRLGGIHGDRTVGMTQLEKAIAGGRYLRGYAQVLLALASLREKRPQRAQDLLAQLVAEYPQNQLFARELAKMGALTGPK